MDLLKRADDAAISALVQERVLARNAREYGRADAIKARLERQYDVLLTDVARKRGGGCTWAYRTHFPETGTGALMTAVRSIKARASHDREGAGCGHGEEDALVATLKTLVRQDAMTTLLKDRELQGRRHADVAFDMALAGVSDAELFALLASGARRELERCGARKSMRGVDIVILCERFAAAGVRDEALFELAAQKIEIKLAGLSDSSAKRGNMGNGNGSDGDDAGRIAMLNRAVARLRSGVFGLMDDRALALLWRHSARQHKSGRQAAAAKGTQKKDSHQRNVGFESLRASSLFQDASLPLVIDLGCGYGTSLIGLCDAQRRAVGDATNVDAVFNFLGVDMSREAIRFGQSVSRRWFPDDDGGGGGGGGGGASGASGASSSSGGSGSCRFVEADCESALDWVLQEYPGPVHWVLCQFPSPYRLKDIFPGADEIGSNVGGGGGAGGDTMLDLNHKRRKVMADSSGGGVRSSGGGGGSNDVLHPGNSQLPGLKHFMFSRDLVVKIEEVMSAAQVPEGGGSSDANVRGMLLQSNAEDVCVTMRAMVEDRQISSRASIKGGGRACGTFRLPLSPDEPRMFSRSKEAHNDGADTKKKKKNAWVTDVSAISQAGDTREGSRLMRYLELSGQHMSGPPRRAVGEGYLRSNPFPSRTETEVTCAFQEKSVHRVCFIWDHGETASSESGVPMR